MISVMDFVAAPHDLRLVVFVAMICVVATALALVAGLTLMSARHRAKKNDNSALRRAIDAVPAGLVVADPAGRIRAWNRSFTQLMADCGHIPTAGSDYVECLMPAIKAGWFGEAALDDPRWLAGLKASVRAGPTEWRLPDGRWLDVAVRPTSDGGSVTVMKDVTRVKADVAALAAARDAAESANRAKSEFLANVSHEIRTPLNGVLGIADVLAGGDLSPEQLRLVRAIKESGILLDGQLTDLLDLARMEAGVAPLRLEHESLGSIVRSVIDLHSGRAESKGLAIRLTISADADTDVICDARVLRQSLGNLVANAIKFTAVGEVALTVTRLGDHVRFEVRDTGVGFDPAIKATLFDRFHQGDNSMTRRHGGVGLGLTICRERVTQMGGVIECDSKPGVGSIFAFELELPAIGAVASQDDSAARDDGHHFRVLVVDDNPVNRQVLEMILDSVALEHSSVENGAESVEAFMTGDYDTVLMDIQMPVMDGLEATRRIRAWEAACGRNRTPIIIVSANCLKEHVDAGRAAGADAHLDKPISAAALINAISTHAEEAAQAAQAAA
jgi:signal transduction histidine kinase/ActR/RegA family two-component response regulator